MTKDQILARIGADNDQDRAACDRWMREASNDAKLRVWLLIQQEFKDPYMEILYRFAQLAFGEAMERTKERRRG